MTLGIDLILAEERTQARLAESPIFDALVCREEFAGTEKYLDTDLPCRELNRKFYWRVIREGKKTPLASQFTEWCSVHKAYMDHNWRDHHGQ